MMISNQQLAGRYLTGVGYEVSVVSETAAMIAALKDRRPYAVVIDQKMGSAGGWPGGAGQVVGTAEIRHFPTRSCNTSSTPASRLEYRR
jgi:CheY-like chemotaxis protein